jgi:hypothetical protein
MEHNMHINGQCKSYTREDSGQIILGESANGEPLIENILDKKYVIISIIGSHAGDEISWIFSSKTQELQRNGKTYWLIKSHKARTLQIQEFCEQAKKENEDVYCLFITASTDNGAKKTISKILAKEISENKNDWAVLSDGVEIKGKMDLQSTALVLSKLEVFNTPKKIDLEDYSEVDIKQNILSIKLRQGASTICSIKVPSVGMKSSLRTVVAYGKLVIPYAVWVR